MLKCRIPQEELSKIYFNFIGSDASITALVDAVVADLNAQLAERQAATGKSDEELVALAEIAFQKSGRYPYFPNDHELSIKSRKCAYHYLIDALRALFADAPQPPQPTPSRGDAAWEAVAKHKLTVRPHPLKPWRWVALQEDDMLASWGTPMGAVERALELLERKAEGSHE